MGLYAGIDLHSTSNYLGIIDEEDKRVYKKKLPNDLDTILQVLEPFKENLSGIALESTFNWYWLVDGLMDNDYKMHLANPSAFQQYEGLKHTDDKWDSFWLAHMLRLGILPEGYIYPKEDRPIRDLLRRRLMLVQHRTAHLLSLQSMISRVIGIHMSGNQIKKLKEVDAKELFDHPCLVLAVENSISVMGFLKERIMIIEKAVTSKTKVRDEFKFLQTIPGVGKILTLTIMLEVGDIKRFRKVGNYSSYCRCVKSGRFSAGKKKGKGNQKNGNSFLAWAYIEAANFARRYCPCAQKFFQRKEAKTNGLVAIKALSNKIARASYYIMRDQVEYDPDKLFG